MTRFKVLFVLLVLLLASVPVIAQETTSSIQGTVVDQSGAALPGVTVDAVNQRGQKYTAVSDNAGRYRFPSVAPGTYTLKPSLAGMEGGTVRNLQITLGASPKVDLKMQVGKVSELVTVTAEAPVVDVTQSAKSTNIRAETFERLPKGRDFTTVVTQAAGANNETRLGGISVDGATGLENVYVIDGVNTTDPRLGTAGKRVITDEVDEIQVKSSGYEAEFGGATGGVVNVVTKTGSNNFTGSVSAYYRNNSMNGAARQTLQQNAAGTAPEYVTYKKDKYNILEPGVTLGGPFVRDRFWFFGSYQPSIQKTDRNVTFTSPGAFAATQKFSQDTNQPNGLATVNGNLGAQATFKVAGNWSGSTVKDALPGQDGRGGANPSLYSGLRYITDTNTYSGYFDYIPTSALYLSARGGRYDQKYHESGISSDVQKWFYRGSNSVFPDTPADLVRPAGFVSIPTNSQVKFDNYKRNNFALESSVFANAAGSHSIKFGWQNENVSNSVLSGNQNTAYRFEWNRNDRFFKSRGKYGAVGVMMFQTTGDVTSKGQSLFLQDAWSTMNGRLTLNFGVRAENEKVPNYGPAGGNAIDWKWSDKTAPRFGFAYDLSGNGRSKVYGSYGKFYDRMKLALARGSWGGDKWLWHAFKLETYDWTAFNCTGVSNKVGSSPTCTGGTYIGTIDLREPTTDYIDPNIKPMSTQEYTIGGQQELGQQMSVGVRYVHKQILRAIEDLGTLVQTGPNSYAESYTIGNPGFGLTTVGTPTIPGFPKATRKYDGLEFELTKRFSNNWGLHATYLYSRTRGNYAGLANPDEGTGNSPRIEPNVSRWGDFIETIFDASGSKKSTEGNLPGDRPSQFKAQVSYQAPFGTNFGLNQYIGQGTPVSTIMFVHAAEFYPFGRGDLGRTPWLYQTDLVISHRIPIQRYGLELAVNVINLFDSKTAVAIYQPATQDSVKEGGDSFFAGFDARKELSTLNPDVLYKQKSAFQGAREVRLSARFIF